MPTFVMFGTYSPESLRAISRKRSDEARALIKQDGGEIKAEYALLSEIDLVVIVELPDNKRAIQVAVALTRLLGVHFTTAPTLTIEEFDRLMSRWDQSRVVDSDLFVYAMEHASSLPRGPTTCGPGMYTTARSTTTISRTTIAIAYS